jgi:hypothetical protein
VSKSPLLMSAEFQDGFGCVESPARACDVHAVFYDVSAGAFDDAGCCAPFKLGTLAPTSMGIGGWGTKK